MKKYSVILWFMWSAMAIWAQSAQITMADLPYLCDFENPVENAKWVLNPGVDKIVTNNRWVIGDDQAYTGQQSMYVSNDGGETAAYAATNNVILAYRDISLDEGEYDIAYDWKGMGNKNNGYLKIVYANRPTTSLNCLGNSAEPTWVSSAIQLTGNNTTLVDGDAWYHIQTRITIYKAHANKSTTRILFVWVNTNATIKEENTSIAIDNFQLAKASPNDYPNNLHVTTQSNITSINWEGAAEQYEVLFRKKDEAAFQSLETTGNSVSIKNAQYGAYEFWICGINGEDKTIYSVFPTIYLYETDCFDALNMYNATFEYGSWQHTSGRSVKGYERIDYGPKDIRSRHTTHFDSTEVDPRTVMRKGTDTVAFLYTVPRGEYGSVRLGNWNTGSQYESITYTYNVESNANAVLIIHYAMVLENPDHTGESQPRFTLDVLDENGTPIDTKCASVDFHAPTAKEWAMPDVKKLWHESDWEGHRIDWQEWRTLGISMEEYIGQTLTITLTSYDCDQGGHFGYAYFMLNCSRSDVDGLPWGEGSKTQKFTAPLGFNYAWFNRTDIACKDTLSWERDFYVQESDTNTYICHVTYPSNSECGFLFDASAKPHTPKAELEWKWTPANCVNGMTYYNRCHVVLTNQETGEEEHRYDKHLELCSIVLPDGTEQKLEYVEDGFFVPIRDEGDTLTYEVRTGIWVRDTLFADTAIVTIPVPKVGLIEQNLYDSICLGDEIIFPNRDSVQVKRTATGVYTDSLISVVTGCDSVIVMHLTVHDPIYFHLFDTICHNGSYDYHGRTLTESGEYNYVTTSARTHCDSMVVLHLTKAVESKVYYDSTMLCASDPIVFTTYGSEYVDSFQITIPSVFDTIIRGRQENQQLTVPAMRLPAGRYTAVVSEYMKWCDVPSQTFHFDINLPSSVVEARFDDVMALLNEKYNGGYTYLSYQWYYESTPEEWIAIDGATRSFYYQPGLDQSVRYTVRVQMSDGTYLWICPFYFSECTDLEQIQSTVPMGKKLIKNNQLYILRQGCQYDVLGRKVND